MAASPLSKMLNINGIPETKKMISIFVPVSEWKALRMESAQSKKKETMSSLCRKQLSNYIKKLVKKHGTALPKEGSE